MPKIHKRKPVILTNAFLRPRGSYNHGTVEVCDKTKVYGCVEEIVNVIHEDLDGVPLLLPTIKNHTDLDQILSFVDGIILPGGFSNIHPSLSGRPYGDDPPQFPDIDIAHDHTDLTLIKEAIERKIPILGICRGMQAMNVALGGTVDYINDITNHNHNNSKKIDHNVSLKSDGASSDPKDMHIILTRKTHDKLSSLDTILCGMPDIFINSIHEQAIRDLSPSLECEAYSEDGIIEAVSLPDHPFFLGVQWHPEAQRLSPVSTRIFSKFKESIMYHS